MNGTLSRRSRRALLRTLGAGGIGALAGCSGGSEAAGEDRTTTDATRVTHEAPDPSPSSTTRRRKTTGSERTGPARFEAAAVTAPDRLVAGETGRMTVSVTNRGGRRGDFTSGIGVRTSADPEWRDAGVSVDLTVRPGETATDSFEISWDYLGWVEWRVDELARELRVEFVEPSFRFGESYADPLGRSVAATVLGERPYVEYVDRAGDTRRLYPDEREKYVQTEITVENASEYVVRTPSNHDYRASTGDLDRTVPPASVRTDEDEWYQSHRELRPGERHDGRLVFPADVNVSVETVLVLFTARSEGAEFGAVWSRDGEIPSRSA